MIDFMNLKISFGKKIIVKEMNDQFSENKIIGLVAPNGTGKTTLLRTLAGIKKPATWKWQVRPACNDNNAG